jgi:hypothetical protein
MAAPYGLLIGLAVLLYLIAITAAVLVSLAANDERRRADARRVLHKLLSHAKWRR